MSKGFLPLDRPCSECGETDITKFTFQQNGKYRRSRCKACNTKAVKQWRIEHPDRVKQANLQWQRDNRERHNANGRAFRKRHPGMSTEYNHRYRYGITLAERREIERQMGNQCPICKKIGELVTDHDHNTNRIRGLICRECNLLLGNAYDNPEVLRNAAEYLEAYAEETGKHFYDEGNGRRLVMIRGKQDR